MSALSREVVDASGNSRSTLSCGPLLLTKHSIKDVCVADVGKTHDADAEHVEFL